MCDPDLLACDTPCPCWQPTCTTVGDHAGHCCMLRDGHTTPPTTTDWRTGNDECRPPATLPTEPPC